MQAARIAGIVLIVAGAAALLFGGFSYTRDSQEATIGPVHLSVQEKKDVPVPVWMGLVAILAGGVLVFRGARS